MVRGVVLLHIPFLNLYDPNGLSDLFGPVDLKPHIQCLFPGVTSLSEGLNH